MIWKTEISLEKIAEKTKNTLMEYLDINFFEIGNDFLCARMAITPKHRQPMGVLHGGASCALAESVGSMAASFCIDSKIHYCVGIALNINHMKLAASGLVIAKALPLHLGRSTQVWNISIVNEENKLVASSQLTMGVLSL